MKKIVKEHHKLELQNKLQNFQVLHSKNSTYIYVFIHVYTYTSIDTYTCTYQRKAVFFQRAAAKTAGGKQPQRNRKSLRANSIKKVPNTLETDLCNSTSVLGEDVVILPSRSASPSS